MEAKGDCPLDSFYTVFFFTAFRQVSKPNFLCGSIFGGQITIELE